MFVHSSLSLELSDLYFHNKDNEHGQDPHPPPKAQGADAKKRKKGEGDGRPLRGTTPARSKGSDALPTEAARSTHGAEPAKHDGGI